MRTLCFDFGSKTIGVAVSDPMGWTAQGVTTLERKNDALDFQAIDQIMKEYQVEQILVGLPLQMNGQEGTQATSVRKWVQKLEVFLEGKTPVLFWDERLSTVAAERGLLEADLSRAKRRKVINQIAAVFILQGYFNSH